VGGSPRGGWICSGEAGKLGEPVGDWLGGGACAQSVPGAAAMTSTKWTQREMVRSLMRVFLEDVAVSQFLETVIVEEGGAGWTSRRAGTSR
jgi:hypothetical protein